MSGLVIGTAAYASGQLAAFGIHRAAIDGNAAALGIILVATDGGCIVAACDVDSDAADGERSYAVGTVSDPTLLAPMPDLPLSQPSMISVPNPSMVRLLPSLSSMPFLAV